MRVGEFKSPVRVLAAIFLRSRETQAKRSRVKSEDMMYLQRIGQQHVHFADGPCAAVEFLTGQFQIARISACFLNVLLRPDQHTARAHSRVEDAHAFLRINQQHQQFDNFGRRIELAAFLASTVSEVLDQIFVSGTQQVGEFEIIIRQQDVGEVLDDVDQRAVVERSLTNSPVEVDALQNILKRVWIRILHRRQSFVQPGTDVSLLLRCGKC
jgi:hypothetical protein